MRPRHGLGCFGLFLVLGVSIGPSDAWSAPGITLKLSNPTPLRRPAETLSVSLQDVLAQKPEWKADRLVVREGTRTVLSQLVDMDGDEKWDHLVFQRDFSTRQTRTVTLEEGERPRFKRADFKVYGRFVRERQDDFAWENDRVIHRMYGPALESWKKEPLVSSGIDAWCKSGGGLVVNDWYLVDDYHRNGGKGGDFYSVRQSRGIGGTGIWQGDRPYVSRNFVRSRVLANGPIRLIFELEYADFDVAGAKISETKRVILDAGSHFNRFTSIFRGGGKELSVGIGLARHAGADILTDRKLGQLRGWEALVDKDKKPAGHLASGILVDPKQVVDLRQTPSDEWVMVTAKPGEPVRFLAGTAWDQGSSFAKPADWDRHLEEMRVREKNPIEVRIAPSDSQETARSQP